jgi:hypothetical protein
MLETPVKKKIVPYDTDNSCHYKLLFKSLSIGLIKLETYLSILEEKKLFLTFKNRWEGESI